ncbi:MAG TPA: addiction module antitoxin [Phenylobacterium sp.]|jgi:Arc/MetJ-type ribon-helix-helix transcriptional regulator
MTKPMHLNVRLTGALGEFVAANTGADGVYDNASEYVRDLIRQDKARAEAAAFERLKAELQAAFAQPDDSARPFDVEAAIARNRRRHDGEK